MNSTALKGAIVVKDWIYKKLKETIASKGIVRLETSLLLFVGI